MAGPTRENQVKRERRRREVALDLPFAETVAFCWSSAGMMRRIWSSTHLLQLHSGIIKLLFGHFATGDSPIGTVVERD
jgi:hypothetical protein